MAGDPLRKVQPGDSLDPLKSAKTFNCIIDAAADFKARTAGLRRKAPDITPQRTIIPVKNMTGSQRNRFDVAAIGQPIFDLTGDAGKARPAALAIEPDGETELDKILVFLEPANVGDIAKACVAGITVARVNVNTATDLFCRLGDGQCTALESQSGAAAGYILWAPDGETGSQLCLIQIGRGVGYDRCTCLMKGTTGSGSKASCTADNVQVIRGISPLDDPTDTSEELSVYNKHGWEFDDNGAADIEWNQTEERWEIYQIDCQA